MTCDFGAYNAARQNTNTKAETAAQRCVELEEAEAALAQATADRDAAENAKTTAYADWQTAERAENAEATNLGIQPCQV